jgi:Uma2 family endonuclease
VTFVEAGLLARAQRAVDDVLPDGVTVEVLEGMLVVNPPPSLDHALLTDRIGHRLERLVSPGLQVNWAGMGVHEHDGPDAEYQVPDVVVFPSPAPGAVRLVGCDVEAVVEIVSPTNRRQADYATAVAARAVRYGIPWVLVVDPEPRSLRWFHDGEARPAGPDWAADLHAVDLFG